MIFLLYLEFSYLLSFKEGILHALHNVSFGLMRDLFFLIVIGEVMLFYKNAVAKKRFVFVRMRGER